LGIQAQVIWDISLGTAPVMARFSKPSAEGILEGTWAEKRCRSEREA